MYNVSMVCAVDFHGMFISTSKYVSNFLILKIIVTIKNQSLSLNFDSSV
jgi:hypothetical protein